MIKSILLWIVYVLIVVSGSKAFADLPLCKEVFSDGISENLGPVKLNLPKNLPEPEVFPCTTTSCELIYEPGDYNYRGESKVVIPKGAKIITKGATTRLYFKNLTIGDWRDPGLIDLNFTDQEGQALPPENLLIYVTGAIKVYGYLRTNSLIYAAGTAHFSDESFITGSVAVGGQVPQFAGDVQYDSNAVESADMSGICLNNPIKPTECFVDEFSRDNLGDDWVTAKSLGDFMPSIPRWKKRLRLTEAVDNQSTSATFQRYFPADENLIFLEFDHFAHSRKSLRGADGVAVVLSDSSVTPKPGAFGGPLGYGYRDSTNDGFAGGWLGIGLDEYGNFSMEGGGKGNGPGKQVPQSIVIRGSGKKNQYTDSWDSGYAYLKGSCNNGNFKDNCIDDIDDYWGRDFNRYQIIIDSRDGKSTRVSVNRKTDSSSKFDNVIKPFDVMSEKNQSNVPDEFYLTFTSGTGDYNNIHEIDNVEICALKSRSVGEQIHHFELTYHKTPLTCSPLNIEIKACKNESCDELYTEQVRANLSPENLEGEWSSNPVTFTGGKTIVQLRNFTPSKITLDIPSSFPSTRPMSDTLCSSGGEYNAGNCALNFQDAGFVFDIPDKIAGKPASNIEIYAVENSSPGRAEGQCLPYLGAPRDVNFRFSYSAPNSGNIVGSPKPTVNGVGLESAYKPVRVNFNSQGKGLLEVNYPDAGEIKLEAKHSGTGSNQGLKLEGSDTFVSFPAGLCVEPEQTCTKGNARCPVFKKTGQPFDITVKGVAWQQNPPSSGDFCDYSTATPNYAHEGLAITSNLKTPAAGVNAIVEGCRQVNGGTVCDQPATFTGWQKGNDNTRQFNVSEVGVFTFTAAPPDEYLGSPGVVIDGKMQPVQPATSKPVGRFIPDHFVLNNGDITPGCHVFSYMAEPFSISGDLVAQNHKGATTQNYRGNFAKASTGVVAENDDDGRNLSVRLDSHLGTQSTTSQSIETNWRAGVAAIEDQIVFSRGTVLDGPYDNMDIGISLSDPDGIELTGKNMHPGQAGECGANCTAVELGTQMMRYGRGHVEYAVGPLNETVKSKVEARYWNGSDWVRNDKDNCSVLGNVSLTASGTHVTPFPVPAGVSRSWPDSKFNDGQTTLHWLSNRGFEGEVTASVPMPAWLKYYWNWGGSSPDANVDPRASVYFGIFRGHDRVVFWREVN